MMRYQRVSPDCFPLNHGRKFNLRTCKEEDADSSRISNCNGFEGNPLRFKPGSTSQDHNFSQLLSDSSQPENHSPVKTQNNQESGHGGDILLQWGQRKRSRGARAENRLVTDETSTQARQMTKIQRRVISGVEKRAINQAIVAGSYTRGANLRTTCFSVRETRGSLPNSNRNLEERSVTGNCPQTSNGNGNSRSHSRSAERQSPSSPEKMDKPASSTVTAANGEKPKGPTVQTDAMNIESVPQSEPEAGVAAEKLNLDLFEWPRIYIALSRKEKEDDFFAMKGTKLPQRPKKRAKNVDKTLQYCFPGMWLSDLTRSRYEVREKKCVVKKGLSTLQDQVLYGNWMVQHMACLAFIEVDKMLVPFT